MGGAVGELVQAGVVGPRGHVDHDPGVGVVDDGGLVLVGSRQTPDEAGTGLGEPGDRFQGIGEPTHVRVGEGSAHQRHVDLSEVVHDPRLRTVQVGELLRRQDSNLDHRNQNPSRVASRPRSGQVSGGRSVCLCPLRKGTTRPMRISVIKVTGHADVADAASLNRSGTPRCDVVARLGVAFGGGQAGHEVVLRCAVRVPLVVLDVDDVAGSCPPAFPRSSAAPYDRRPRIIINHSVDIRRRGHTVASTKQLRFGGRDE